MSFSERRELFFERRHQSDRRQPGSADDLYRRLKEKRNEIETERRKMQRRQTERRQASSPNPSSSNPAVEAQRWPDEGFVEETVAELHKDQ